jgi:hypothetical protein
MAAKACLGTWPHRGGEQTGARQMADLINWLLVLSPIAVTKILLWEGPKQRRPGPRIRESEQAVRELRRRPRRPTVIASNPPMTPLATEAAGRGIGVRRDLERGFQPRNRRTVTP